MTMTAPGGNGGGQSKAIVKGPQARLNNIKDLLTKSKGAIAAVLPKHLTTERLIRIATSAASRTPDLLDCTPESLLLSLVQCGLLGLEPNTPLHHAALVPFKNNKVNPPRMEATLIVEYRGLCQLAYNSGDVVVIYAEAIHANDEYDIELGTNKRIMHRPATDGDPGAVVGFYAVVKFKHGGEDFAWMSKSQVDAIRDASPSKNSDAWVKHYEEMGKKTAIRRLSKTMPMSSDKSIAFARAVVHDGKQAAGEIGDYGEVIEIIGESTDSSDDPKTRTEALAEKLESKAGAPAT